MKEIVNFIYIDFMSVISNNNILKYLSTFKLEFFLLNSETMTWQKVFYNMTLQKKKNVNVKELN